MDNPTDRTYTLEVHNLESGEIIRHHGYSMINDALFFLAHEYGYPKCKDLDIKIFDDNVTYYEWKC